MCLTETVEDASEDTVLDTSGSGADLDNTINSDDGSDRGGYGGSDIEGGHEVDIVATDDTQNEEVSTALPNMNMRYLTLRHMDTPHRPVHALPSPTTPVQYVEYMHASRDGKRCW